MKLLSSLFKSNSLSETDILNAGLSYAMEFGTNLLQPIQNRLSKKFPQLNQAELAYYNDICQDAMRFGHTFIYNRLIDLHTKGEKITSKELKVTFENHIKEKYAWVSSYNFNALFNQGMYYAWKDGLDKSVT